MAVMPIKQPSSAADRFRTVTLRVDTKNRTAVFDGVQSLYYGDTLIVVVENISGVVATDLQLWLWKKEVATNPANALAYFDTFTNPTGRGSAASATIVLTSDNLRLALLTTPVGTPITARLIIREAAMPVVDMDVCVYPNPYINATPIIDPDDVAINPYVRRSDLRQWALDLLASADLSTADGMAAALSEVITKLSDVTSS